MCQMEKENCLIMFKCLAEVKMDNSTGSPRTSYDTFANDFAIAFGFKFLDDSIHGACCYAE